MYLRCLGLILALGLFGCARNLRPEAEPALIYEQVQAQPLAEALANTRRELEGQGYTFEPSEDVGQLRTTWRPPGPERLVISGVALGPQKTRVRIFRVRGGAQAQEALGAQATASGAGEKLEDVLARKLAPDAASQAAGEAGEELKPTRSADFYLDRWQQEEGGKGEGACPERVRYFRDVVRPGLTLLIGEQLGTLQVPRVVGNLVCEAAQAGHAVVLGLNIPRHEQAAVDRYLASPGRPVDQDVLLREHFWTRPFQDGRSSWAMVDLLDRVRAMRASGLSVALIAYDTSDHARSERDSTMAEVWLKRRKAHPDEVFILVAGNVHARTHKGATWDRSFTPLGWHLAKADPAGVKSLDLSFDEGTRWSCELDVEGEPDCGIVAALPSLRVAGTPGQSPYVRIFSEKTEEGFHGQLYVGALSPSMPATSLAGHDVPLGVMPRALSRGSSVEFGRAKEKQKEKEKEKEKAATKQEAPGQAPQTQERP
jgi:hypothetical protein